MQQDFLNFEILNESSKIQIPGLFYYPKFITSDFESELIKQIDSLEWSNELKRRVQHYGYKYDYKKKKIDKADYLGPLPNIFEPIIKKLKDQKIILRRPDQLIVNEYLPGQGISKHIDCTTCFDKQIVSLSLGSNCVMVFKREKFEGNYISDVFDLLLERCSVLSIIDSARYNWSHSINPKSSDNGIKRTRRISLTFRNVIL